MPAWASYGAAEARPFGALAFTMTSTLTPRWWASTSARVIGGDVTATAWRRTLFRARPMASVTARVPSSGEKYTAHGRDCSGSASRGAWAQTEVGSNTRRTRINTSG